MQRQFSFHAFIFGIKRLVAHQIGSNLFLCQVVVFPQIIPDTALIQPGHKHRQLEDSQKPSGRSQTVVPAIIAERWKRSERCSDCMADGKIAN